jgi:hypothetical protein
MLKWGGVAAAMLLLAGCGGGEGGDLPATVDANGVVTLDGTPVEGASVVFAPVAPGEYPAFAMSDGNGKFELKAFEAKGGAVPGSYKVQVSKTVEVAGANKNVDLGEDAEHADQGEEANLMWENALPEKYANPDSSGLTVEIPSDGTNDIKLELVSG